MGPVAELWRRPIQWFKDHPLATDALFALVLAALGLTIHFASDEVSEGRAATDPSWWTVPLVVAALVVVVARRRLPVATVLAAVALQAACEVALVQGPGWLGVLVAVYSLAAYAERRRRTFAAYIAVGVAIVSLLLVGVLVDDVPIPDVIGALAVVLTAFVVGDNMRRRRDHVQSLAERVERAEREQELLARERVGEERTRIARELHDIVAHSVSVMVLQAGAARRQFDRDPAASVELLRSIEDTGRGTMDELRQVLGVLRDGDREIEAAPLPTLADLEELVRAEPELAVDLDVTGEVASVPGGVALSTYRVVQEALTNSRRHAGPGVAVSVRVACAPDGVDVMVDDDGRGASTNGTVPGGFGGYGLLGMRERAGAVGGSVIAGPKIGGGWRVKARFPISTSS